MTKTQDAVDDVRHTAEEGAESAKRFLGVFKKSALDVADVARHELVDTLEDTKELAAKVAEVARTEGAEVVDAARGRTKKVTRQSRRSRKQTAKAAKRAQADGARLAKKARKQGRQTTDEARAQLTVLAHDARDGGRKAKRSLQHAARAEADAVSKSSRKARKQAKTLMADALANAKAQAQEAADAVDAAKVKGRKARKRAKAQAKEAADKAREDAIDQAVALRLAGEDRAHELRDAAADAGPGPARRPARVPGTGLAGAQATSGRARAGPPQRAAGARFGVRCGPAGAQDHRWPDPGRRAGALRRWQHHPGQVPGRSRPGPLHG